MYVVRMSHKDSNLSGVSQRCHTRNTLSHDVLSRTHGATWHLQNKKPEWLTKDLRMISCCSAEDDTSSYRENHSKYCKIHQISSKIIQKLSKMLQNREILLGRFDQKLLSSSALPVSLHLATGEGGLLYSEYPEPPPISELRVGRGT